VTVRPGETLSEIAVREMPALPMREAVARIAIANDLPSSHLSAGQSLVIPKS
jgi:predicted Zn-dependent protease